jgi:uncharacterized membrane protein YczE
MAIIGLGVSPMIRSDFGVSSWDTLNYSLMNALDIPFALASAITATTALLLIIILYQSLSYFVMIIPIILISLFIYLFDSVIFTSLQYDSYLEHIAGFIFGMLLLPLGGSLIIITKLPAAVYDELMLAVMSKTNSTRLPIVRSIIELTVILIALIIGIIGGIGTGRIGAGTLVFALVIGWMIRFYLTLFERMGLYET